MFGDLARTPSACGKHMRLSSIGAASGAFRNLHKQIVKLVQGITGLNYTYISMLYMMVYTFTGMLI